MPTPKIVFFGSFLEHSAEILESLLDASRTGQITVLGAVTTPPQPAGRKQALKKTEVQEVAEAAGLPIFTPETLTTESLAELETLVGGKPDLIVTAGYGKLLPASWLSWPQTAALNLHFSLLPKYRGANPAEWAILMGETETGITLIEMSPEFDTGELVSQIAIPIAPHDTRETIYTKLYSLGAETLPSLLQAYFSYATAETSGVQLSGQLQESLVLGDKVYQVTFFYPPLQQTTNPTPYAKRFQKDDAFVAWEAIVGAMRGEIGETEQVGPLLHSVLEASQQTLDARFLERATRALAGFPSLWTKVTTAKGEKRLKILSAHLEEGASDDNARQPVLVLDEVQLEGQSPARWNQIKNSVL